MLTVKTLDNLKKDIGEIYSQLFIEKVTINSAYGSLDKTNVEESFQKRSILKQQKQRLQDKVDKYYKLVEDESYRLPRTRKIYHRLNSIRHRLNLKTENDLIVFKLKNATLYVDEYEIHNQHYHYSLEYISYIVDHLYEFSINDKYSLKTYYLDFIENTEIKDFWNDLFVYEIRNNKELTNTDYLNKQNQITLKSYNGIKKWDF